MYDHVIPSCFGFGWALGGGGGCLGRDGAWVLRGTGCMSFLYCGLFIRCGLWFLGTAWREFVRLFRSGF
jgi:hypothetical protein